MLSKERNQQKKDINIQILEKIENQLKDTREIKGKITHRIYKLLQFEENKKINQQSSHNSKFETIDDHFSIVKKLDLLFNQYYLSIDNIINDIQDIIGTLNQSQNNSVQKQISLQIKQNKNLQNNQYQQDMELIYNQENNYSSSLYDRNQELIFKINGQQDFKIQNQNNYWEQVLEQNINYDLFYDIDNNTISQQFKDQTQNIFYDFQTNDITQSYKFEPISAQIKKSQQLLPIKYLQNDRQILSENKSSYFSEITVNDCEKIRIGIPEAREINISMIFNLIKQLIGKDLTKITFPVFINEPANVLMKPAEFMFFNDYLTQASQFEDSTLRMLYVAVSQISAQFCVPGRFGKPFNPFLGETYELVTPKFKFFSEMVSHHPPICCWHCKGSNYTIQRTMETKQQFTGKKVKIIDKNSNKIQIQLKDSFEIYLSKEPEMVLGNIFFGEKYTEPQGSAFIQNTNTLDTADINYIARGWSTNPNDLYRVEASIKDKFGKIKYKIEGSYTNELICIDLETNKSWVIFKAPEKPQNSKQMFGMSYYSLQLNQITEQLAQKLPPTDSRFRPDMKYWEINNLELASSEKSRLELNQRQRREILKNKLKQDPDFQQNWDILDERTYYKPKFFDKICRIDQDGKISYQYEPKISNHNKEEYFYWFQRDKGIWNDIPKIYDDECEPFY